MQYAFKTDVGRLRPHNEDNGGIFGHQDGTVLAVVADGMGGHQAGDVASLMTKELLLEKWESSKRLDTPTAAEEWLVKSINQVNERLYQHAKENPECQGMGTTVVATICTSEFVTIAHIGDSRCYLLNTHGFAKKTEDHSLVNELVRNGQITEDEAENHPRKNVLLRALGTEVSIKVDVHTIDWDAGDYLLLCSDGLSNKISEDRMKEILQENVLITEKVEQLVKVANDLGGEDNITVALIKHASTSKEQDQ